MSNWYNSPFLLTIESKKGIIDPLDPITFPYRTTLKAVDFAPAKLFALTKSLSEANFEAP